ncbi:hypothetical protein TWF718_002082 [Orbilia javanica]|uniref:Uncharacterized protein n=1 Tax=Orbilia javanica TaxID=47235 RepID=A0AAN8N635_9PEZI
MQHSDSIGKYLVRREIRNLDWSLAKIPAYGFGLMRPGYLMENVRVTNGARRVDNQPTFPIQHNLPRKMQQAGYSPASEQLAETKRSIRPHKWQLTKPYILSDRQIERELSVFDDLDGQKASQTAGIIKNLLSMGGALSCERDESHVIFCLKAWNIRGAWILYKFPATSNLHIL